MGGKRKRFCFRFNPKVSFQFLGGGVGRKPKEAGGEVDDIATGVTAEAVEASLFRFTQNYSSPWLKSECFSMCKMLL